MQFSLCSCPGSPPGGKLYLTLPSSARSVCRLVAVNSLLLGVSKINLICKFYTFLMTQINIILHYCLLRIIENLIGGAAVHPLKPPLAVIIYCIMKTNQCIIRVFQSSNHRGLHILFVALTCKSFCSVILVISVLILSLLLLLLLRPMAIRLKTSSSFGILLSSTISCLLLFSIKFPTGEKVIGIHY